MAGSGATGMGPMQYASMAGSATTAIIDTYTEGITARAKASAYRSQARLALIQANQQNRYLNQELAGNVWSQYTQAEQFRSAQNLAHAASGFADYSTGDIRLAADTIRKRNAAVDSANINAYLQSFETQRKAAMEASRLEYAAKAQDVISKTHSGFWGNFVLAPAKGFLSFIGSNPGAFTKQPELNNVRPVGDSKLYFNEPTVGLTSNKAIGDYNNRYAAQNPWSKPINLF